MTIDLTGRYYSPTHMGVAASGGDWAQPWLLSRKLYPARAIVLHHTAGFYGPYDGTEGNEYIQLDAMAADHRQRFGIGPGYHYAAFPSGRLYAIGKWGTHRAHIKGRNPVTGNPWNYDAIGVVAFGDYDQSTVPPALVAAVREAIAEVNTIVAPTAALPVHMHGLTPTVNTAGVAFVQGTACPGRWMRLVSWSVQPAPLYDAGALLEARRVAWNEGAFATWSAFEDAISGDLPIFPG